MPIPTNIYALIENRTVVNIIVADPNFVLLHFPQAVRIDNLMPVPCIGWSYIGGAFKAPGENQ